MQDSREEGERDPADDDHPIGARIFRSCYVLTCL